MGRADSPLSPLSAFSARLFFSLKVSRCYFLLGSVRRSRAAHKQEEELALDRLQLLFPEVFLAHQPPEGNLFSFCRESLRHQKPLSLARYARYAEP